MTSPSTVKAGPNLFALFAEQAVRQPNAPAVIGDAATMTYGGLLDLASAIADSLLRHGLSAEQPVGVLMKRTPDLLATLLGILAAGGCYVPLDPEDPPERTRRVIDGAQCRLVLGHTPLLEELRSQLRPTNPLPDTVELVAIEPMVANETTRDTEAPQPRLPQTVAPGGSRLAYILFTSGSTGTPKGVEIEHRNAVSLALAGRDLFRFTESDRWLATSTIAFDLSVAELFIPLVSGGGVVLRDRRLLQDPHGLARTIREHGVTMFQTVPSVWSVLLAEVPDFPRIRTIATTGEAAPNDLARRLVSVADEVWNLYGPTETTVWATGYRFTTDRYASLSAAAPIGQPLPNVEILILDEHRRPVPVGGEGELWIGGAGLARGYRGNDALTREKFAVLGDDGRRFYRSGDVVAAEANGTLHYFGRCDDQMKVHGVRIEPMEVEAAILKCPGVAKAAVTWYPTAAGSRSIVAAVVGGSGQPPGAEQLHRLLVPALPSSMLPSRFIFCDELPMTPSGKVDRKAIRARVAENIPLPVPVSGQDGRTETERTLAGIWERTLNVRPVSRDAHFFTIGGDSLSAVTMMLEVEATFQISLSFRTAFESPTLDRLAERIDRARGKPTPGAADGQSQADDLRNAAYVFPLTHDGPGRPVFFNTVDLRMAQRGLWTLNCPLHAVTQWAQGSGFLKAKSVEELARVQIDGIRSIQPRGPYRLAGYSFGGVVALEIAHQLKRAGEAIELLFLLDPSDPPGPGSLFSASTGHASTHGVTETLPARIRRHFRHLAANPSSALPYIWRRAFNRFCPLIIREWTGYHLVDFYGRHPNPVSACLLPADRWPAFWYNTQRMARNYTPPPYDGEALAIFISHQERCDTWRKLLSPNADIRTINSDHGSMFFEPALSLWLQPLRDHLEGGSRHV